MVGWTTTVGVGCITSGEDSAAVATGIERVVEALTRLTACCIIKIQFVITGTKVSASTLASSMTSTNLELKLSLDLLSRRSIRLISIFFHESCNDGFEMFG